MKNQNQKIEIRFFIAQIHIVRREKKQKKFKIEICIMKYICSVQDVVKIIFVYMDICVNHEGKKEIVNKKLKSRYT